MVCVTKNSGPGARAPEAVRPMTVMAKFRGSMNVGNCGVNNDFLHVIRKRKNHLTVWMLYFSFSGSQIVWCICVGRKYENVYYISIFNILIRGHTKKGAKT